MRRPSVSKSEAREAERRVGFMDGKCGQHTDDW
jgi:hypothetical protein